MSIFPQTNPIVPGRDQAVKQQMSAEPVGIWSHLTNKQRQHLGQIIGQMMRNWQAVHVEEVRDDGDIN